MRPQTSTQSRPGKNLTQSRKGAEGQLGKQESMNARTLTALKKSIDHWRRLSTGKAEKGEDIGWEHCALCRLFIDKAVQCSGCPVKKRTGNDLCRNSPYGHAEDALLNHGKSSKGFKAAAKEELEFLRSLLPKKGGRN